MRLALFLLGCIPARLALAYALYRFPKSRVLAALAAGIGAGFLVIYLTGARPTGPETFGAPIWWNDLRPLHGALYLLAAHRAWTGTPPAWVPVAMEAAVGLLAFVAHHGLRH